MLKRVAQHFKSQKTYVRRNSNVVFVCGGEVSLGVSKQNPSMRQRFLDYAKINLVNHTMFLAESAEKDYVNHEDIEYHNVGEFEEIIGEFSDCLLIFPESSGSFAELGFFAKNDIIRKKTLVVHDLKYQGDDSFISRGPIYTYDTYSNFKPTIQMSYESPDFSLIKKRLEKRIPVSKRRRLKSTKYANMSNAEKLFCSYEISRLFRIVSIDSLSFAFRSIFDNVSKNDIRRYLSILVASNFMSRSNADEQLFVVNGSEVSFFDFEGFNVEAFHLEVADFYVEEYADLALALGVS